jgi:hypothetical protein
MKSILWFYNIVLILIGVLTMSGQTSVHDRTFQGGATNAVVGPATIDAENAVEVSSGSNVTFAATTSIRLGPGFHAAEGSSFRALVNPPPVPPTGLPFYPTQELTFIHVNESLNVPYHQECETQDSGQVNCWNEYDKIYYWTGSDWAYLYNWAVPVFQVNIPGFYKIGDDHYIWVLTVPPTPSASIWVDNTTVYIGQPTVIHARFTPGIYDTLTNTNIEKPEGNGLLDWSQPTNKDYIFTPIKIGSYTFYARIATAYYGAATYGLVTVEVKNRTPSVTITPTQLKRISLGDTMTYSSVATDQDGNMIGHNFDWCDPDGKWGGQGGEGISTNINPECLFDETGTSSRAIVVTPSRYGDFKVRFTAIDVVEQSSSTLCVLRVITPTTDTDGDGVPDATEIMLGLDPDNPSDIPVANVLHYNYDAGRQLKSGPGKNYNYDKEGNAIKPMAH